MYKCLHKVWNQKNLLCILYSTQFLILHLILSSLHSTIHSMFHIPKSAMYGPCQGNISKSIQTIRIVGHYAVMKLYTIWEIIYSWKTAVYKNKCCLTLHIFICVKQKQKFIAEVISSFFNLYCMATGALNLHTTGLQAGP